MDFTGIVFGHLFGDYMLQSKKMALTKSTPGIKGTYWCLVHCLIYTGSVCLFAWRFDLPFIALVFASHYPIDRCGLGGKWLKLIGGRDFMAAHESEGKYREIDIAFSCLVYAVVDNTMHLALIWLAVK